MKVTGSSQHKNAPKADAESAREITTDSKNIVLGQIKLEDLEQERLEVRKAVEKKTTTKKPVEKKAVSAVKAAETEIKAAEVKAEETKATEAKTVEVKAEEAKAVEVKAEEPKKETKATVKKETKPAAKKETKAAPATKLTLQVNGRADLTMDSLVDRVKAAYVAEGHKADLIKNIEVYIKLSENMAYYVIDGYASGISLY